jgi:hypothetical protein
VDMTLCDECGVMFKNVHDLQSHVKKWCLEKEGVEERPMKRKFHDTMSVISPKWPKQEYKPQASDSDDDVYSCGDDADGDGASSADEDTINPWDSIACGENSEAKTRCLKVLDGYLAQDNMALSTAKAKTYKKLRHYLLDVIKNVYLHKLLFQRSLAKDATTKTILQTAKRLRDRHGFGFDESVQYAVNKLRFLISSKMDKCFFPGNLAAKKRSW